MVDCIDCNRSRSAFSHLINFTPQVLTLHYERHSKYYGSEKGLFATATEEEKRLTMQLFTGIFDSLAQRVR